MHRTVLQEIFELSHDGTQFIAEEVTRHETGPSVVMNCASYNNGKKTWIVAGQESHCQLYNVNSKVVTSENGELIKGPAESSTAAASKDGLRHRKNSEKVDETQSLKDKTEEVKDNNSNVKSKKLQLILKPADSVQTAFG